MTDCMPKWYKKYGETLQHWLKGEGKPCNEKTEYRVYWKDNEGTEYRFAAYATNANDAVMQCAMAYPMIMSEVVKVHPFGSYDLLTKEQFAEMVDDILQRKYNFNKGAVERFMWLVDGGYCRGRTPDEVADGIMYEVEYGDEGT